MNSNKLTKEMLLDIWKSENYFYDNVNDSVIFTLCLSSDASIASLTYLTETNESYIIAEGKLNFTDNNDDSYILKITTSSKTGIHDETINIRMYMPAENKPSFIADIPNFGEITFIRLRPKNK